MLATKWSCAVKKENSADFIKPSALISEKKEHFVLSMTKKRPQRL